MSTQYRLVQSGKTASGGCSAGQGSSEPVAPRIYLFILFISQVLTKAKLSFFFYGISRPLKLSTIFLIRVL
jgi:carbohydrate-binding DOMON domain-containing protein